MLRRELLLIVGCLMVLPLAAGAEESADGWQTIFDGQTFQGWKINENEKSWSIQDGALVAHGDRSHLFYVGDDRPFVNFEFHCEVMTTPGSNGGIYFHTKYLESGWPKAGFETQVNVSHKDPIKTGSLYKVVNVAKPPCKDNEYWTHHILVQGRHVVVKINGETVVDYTEPENKPAEADGFDRRLASGTFALQAHDPQSTVHFKNIRVKRLP